MHRSFALLKMTTLASNFLRLNLGSRYVGRLVIRGFRTALDQSHRVEDRVDYRIVSHSRVEHNVIERTRGPVGIEIVFHVGDALTIDSIDPFDGILFTVAIRGNTADFFRARGVKKNMESVRI